MTGPRPAGRPWTLTDDDMLRKLLVSGMKHRRSPKRSNAPSEQSNREFTFLKSLGSGKKENDPRSSGLYFSLRPLFLF